MNRTDYALPTDDPHARRAARLWLTLAVASLIAAGLFSLLLVMSRTPGIQEIIPWIDFFHVALVVHVDLSVVIWFLAFAGVFWSLTTRPHPINSIAFALTAFGTAIIALAPFVGVGNPLLNNYIPVLQHPLFYTGLAIAGAGFALQAVRTLTSPAFSADQGIRTLQFGTYVAAIAAVAAIAGFVWSYVGLGPQPNAQSYFEYLFWGGGHILQFTHSLLLLVAWIWLASASGLSIKLAAKPMRLLFALSIIPIAVALIIYPLYPVDSAQHRIYFTHVMQYGGLITLPLGLLVVWSIFQRVPALSDQRPLRAALISSIILFAAGGIIGFLIEGVNVVIPAHYHGSIVGVTLAFTGAAYLLLPRLGYRSPHVKLATIQPYIYGGGQLMHILGLAWSGGYGVQRKTAGAAQGLDNLPEIAGMALMGLGGLIAVIGGVLFLIVMLKAMWPVRD